MFRDLPPKPVQNGKSARQKVLATNGNADLKENFINLFGSKQVRHTYCCAFLRVCLHSSRSTAAFLPSRLLPSVARASG